MRTSEIIWMYIKRIHPDIYTKVKWGNPRLTEAEILSIIESNLKNPRYIRKIIDIVGNDSPLSMILKGGETNDDR